MKIDEYQVLGASKSNYNFSSSFFYIFIWEKVPHLCFFLSQNSVWDTSLINLKQEEIPVSMLRDQRGERRKKVVLNSKHLVEI